MLLGVLAIGVAAALPADLGWVEGVFEGQGFLMVLTNKEMGCPEGERGAVAATGKDTAYGCWFERDETIWIWWRDGDRSAIPSKMFKKPPEA
jgi:hypothetical protein